MVTRYGMYIARVSDILLVMCIHMTFFNTKCRTKSGIPKELKALLFCSDNSHWHCPSIQLASGSTEYPKNL